MAIPHREVELLLTLYIYHLFILLWGYPIPGSFLSVLFGDYVNLYIDYSKVVRSVIESVEKADPEITVRITSKQLIILESCIFGVVLGSPGLDW